MHPGAPLLRRHADPEALAQTLAGDVARRLRHAIEARGNASLVVPGGRTPVAFFTHLSREDIDWSRVTVALTDERWVPPTDPASNERLVRDHLLREKAAAARLIGLWNEAADAAAGAIHAWQRLGAVARPFDIVIPGMGEDGHFASLFPDDPASMRALDPDAPPACVATHAPTPPAQRLSLNLAALLQTRALCLLVTGEHKWNLIQEAVQPARARQLPVHALLNQTHAALSVLWSPA